jgi:hypothetical protein
MRDVRFQNPGPQLLVQPTHTSPSFISVGQTFHFLSSPAPRNWEWIGTPMCLVWIHFHRISRWFHARGVPRRSPVASNQIDLGSRSTPVPVNRFMSTPQDRTTGRGLPRCSHPYSRVVYELPGSSRVAEWLCQIRCVRRVSFPCGFLVRSLVGIQFLHSLISSHSQ